MSNKFKPDDYPAITPDTLQRHSESCKCECCGKAFSAEHPPSLAPRCHGGGVIVRHWRGMLYLSCYTCEKPIFKLWIGRRGAT